MLAIDIRLRMNRIEEAEELLRGIAADRIVERLRLPYAHTVALVALGAGKAELAETAATMLRCLQTEEGELPVAQMDMLGRLDRLRG